MRVGQSLHTDHGKVEILLIPGVFLRVGDNTSVELVSAGLTDTELTVIRGHAMVEAAEIYEENNLRIVESGVITRIVKPGLYDFDADQGQVRVFDGEAAVLNAAREIKLKGGHEVTLASYPEKARKFDKNAYSDDDLYRWSSLRSAYLAEANIDEANAVGTNTWYGPAWWWDPFWDGWLWDPWFGAFTFVPADGIFCSPFGWGFYSPGFVHFAPIRVGHFHHAFNPRNVAAWGSEPHYVSSANGHVVARSGMHNASHAGLAGGGGQAMKGGGWARGIRSGFGHIGGAMHRGGMYGGMHGGGSMGHGR